MRIITKPAQVFLALTALVFSSCDKDATFDPGTPADNANLAQSDTATVEMQTVLWDSVSTKNLSKHDLVGCFNDPVFGKSTAIIYGLPKLATGDRPEIGPNSTIDSVVLSLKYNDEDFSYIGDLNDVQRWKVYQLAEKPVSTSEIYSSVDYIVGDELGTYEGPLKRPSEGYLRIKLNDVIAEKVKNAPGTIYDTEESFASFIKGIAIVPDSTVPGDGGAILTLYLNDLSIYHDTTKWVRMHMTNPGFRVNAYRHNYNDKQPYIQAKNPSGDYEHAFLQSMAGFRIKVTMPYLQNYITEQGTFAVNRAEFIFPRGDIPGDNFAGDFPARLYMRPIDENGKTNVSFDEPLGYVDGRYNQNDNSYHFVLTREMQFVLNQYKSIENYKHNGFYLFIPPESPLTPTRAIMNTIHNVNGSKPKLVLTYTKLEE